MIFYDKFKSRYRLFYILRFSLIFQKKNHPDVGTKNEINQHVFLKGVK